MNTGPTRLTQKADQPVPGDKFSAALRISGDGLDLEEISRTLGLTPTRTERKGGHKVKWNDLWLYQAPVPAEKPLGEHIQALWDSVRTQIPFLRELKKKFLVDILCMYVGCYFRGRFEVDQRCLGLFEELDVPLRIGVSISLEHMVSANENSGPDAGGLPQVPIWRRWAACIAQLWRRA